MFKHDVDLEHDILTVRGTKNNTAKRQVPIEPALRPLIAALVETYPEGPLFDVPRSNGGKGGASDILRRDMKRAKIDRALLTRDDDEYMPMTFHGLRHTAITHWAVAGKDQRWLLIVAGHTDIEMTRRYLDEAALVRSSFGTPHPTLPGDLSDGLKVPEDYPAKDMTEDMTDMTERVTKPGKNRQNRETPRETISPGANHTTPANAAWLF